VSLEALEKQIEEAMDEGWSAGDTDEEFYVFRAADAVMRVPLIAAAPELLAALKVFAADGVFEDFPDDFRAQVLAAIAKAEHGT
jgi:DNA-binding IclR family transcriptional regulator